MSNENETRVIEIAPSGKYPVVQWGDEPRPDGCDYCGQAGHYIEACPEFIRDSKEAAERDAATDKSDWPL